LRLHGLPDAVQWLNPEISRHWSPGPGLLVTELQGFGPNLKNWLNILLGTEIDNSDIPWALLAWEQKGELELPGRRSSDRHHTPGPQGLRSSPHWRTRGRF
jgi:hypothetical protein